MSEGLYGGLEADVLQYLDRHFLGRAFAQAQRHSPHFFDDQIGLLVWV